jgi:hypothetical protein
LVALEPKGKRTPILSGQAILLPEDRRYHVELRYKAVGEGTDVAVRSALWSRGETIRFQPQPGQLAEGDTVTLEYVFDPGTVVYDVDVVLRAVARADADVDGAGILVERAVARLEPADLEVEAGAPFEVMEFSVEHADGTSEDLPYHRLDLSSSLFWRNRCIRRGREKSSVAHWRGERCSEGEIIGGPGSFAPTGANVRASLVLEGLEGEGRGHLEVRFVRGAERHGDLDEYGLHRAFEIAPGERVEVEIDEHIETDWERIGIFVVLDEAEPLSFDIEELEFEIVPPSTLVRWEPGGEGS